MVRRAILTSERIGYLQVGDISPRKRTLPVTETLFSTGLLATSDLLVPFSGSFTPWRQRNDYVITLRLTVDGQFSSSKTRQYLDEKIIIMTVFSVEKFLNIGIEF